VLSGLLTPLATVVAAQLPADTGCALQDSAVRVFFDCPNCAPGCDFDFVRTEITRVNWVRNREDADVHALITTQETGGGGREYTLALLGLHRFTGKGNTLRYYATGTSPPGHRSGASTSTASPASTAATCSSSKASALAGPRVCVARPTIPISIKTASSCSGA
jgi:hypothetical protein